MIQFNKNNNNFIKKSKMLPICNLFMYSSIKVAFNTSYIPFYANKMAFYH